MFTRQAAHSQGALHHSCPGRVGKELGGKCGSNSKAVGSSRCQSKTRDRAQPLRHTAHQEAAPFIGWLQMVMELTGGSQAFVGQITCV